MSQNLYFPILMVISALAIACAIFLVFLSSKLQTQSKEMRELYASLTARNSEIGRLKEKTEALKNQTEYLGFTIDVLEDRLNKASNGKYHREQLPKLIQRTLAVHRPPVVQPKKYDCCSQ